MISIVPAGDKEVTNPTDAQWTARMGVMQSAMIYVRNNPSAFFYEAGNSPVSAAQMQALQTLRNTWDPNGGRGVGDRSLATPAGYPIPTGSARCLAAPGTKTPIGTRGPMLEEEDYRDEAMRGIWDDLLAPARGRLHSRGHRHL